MFLIKTRITTFKSSRDLKYIKTSEWAFQNWRKVNIYSKIMITEITFCLCFPLKTDKLVQIYSSLACKKKLSYNPVFLTKPVTHFIIRGWVSDIYPGIKRDKTMADEWLYLSNNEKQNYLICRLQLVVETLGQLKRQSNYNRSP